MFEPIFEGYYDLPDPLNFKQVHMNVFIPTMATQEDTSEVVVTRPLCASLYTSIFRVPGFSL